MSQNHWTKSLGVRIAGVALIAFAALGCAEEANTEVLLGERSDELLFDAPRIWPNNVVPVCFDSADGNNPGLLAEAKRQLEASWDRASLLSFSGWGACNLTRRATGNFSTIVVHFCGGSNKGSANCPAANYFGTIFRGYNPQSGRILPTNHNDGTFTPGATHVSLISDDAQAFLHLFRYQVLHEFGHALGYRHEQDSVMNVDSSGNLICNQEVNLTGTGFEQMQTPFFDNNSIMSYCATDPLARDPATGGTLPPTMLSNGDILGVRVKYGRDSAFHGFMIKSDGNSGLAVNAWGGAAEGTVLRLHQGCTATNPDCTWTYQRGMLVSDKDPSLAINAWGGAGEGVTLRLTRLCKPDNPDCTWTYRRGMFVSDKDSRVIVPWGGAVHSAELKLTGVCGPELPNCTWTLPDVMLSSHRDPSLAVNAFNGATDGKDLKLHNGCGPSNPDCTFTFSKGRLISSKDSTLAVNAWNGAGDLAKVKVVKNCLAANTNCTWTWRRGQIISDNTTNGQFPINAIGGGVHLAPLQLNSACNADNPDCVFWGLFAKP